MLSDLRQRLGLMALNAVARSARYEREEIPFGSHSRQSLDWYRLQGDAITRPTVIFFYGGNWQSGRRQDYRFVADTLLWLGCDVVIPDYRLYPQVRFDAMLADAQAALGEVLARLPTDSPVILMGHSAGAQLAALLALDISLGEGIDCAASSVLRVLMIFTRLPKTNTGTCLVPKPLTPPRNP